MAVERPTFSESWYRVTALRPRLRSTVQVSRQHFRGQMWHVLQDPGANQFFRLNEAAYHFVAMLDGRRTVGQVWHTCNDELGDSAPTQGEAIQLLGQLYASNLLSAELPPDAEGLLKRYKKRRLREVQGYMTNLLFVRIPLIDPDHFLDAWVGLFGKVFSVIGFLLWICLIATGIYWLAPRMQDLADSSQGIFDPSNLALLYLSMVAIKIIHEFGHGFSCKRFGKRAGGGGEVHVMGVMFLIFTPLPYVDASSAWALRSKWQRAMIGAAGMYIELAIAAVAAIVWANTEIGTLHAICYNIMFIASISTLLFNGNPLLRYDAYYILSDLLEIPNLSQRSKDFIYYLVKRYIWGVKRARNPAHSIGERIWFVFYGVASTLYRIFILVMILAFLGDRLPEQLRFVAIILGGVSLVMWLFVPLGKFLKYLAVSPELARSRTRAVITTLVFVGGVVAGIGMVPAPEHVRLEGIVELERHQVIYADTDGFVYTVMPSDYGRDVTPDGPALIKAVSPELQAARLELLAAWAELLARKAVALDAGSTVSVQAYDKQLAVSKRRLADIDRRIAALDKHAPFAGRWISPNIEQALGAYVRQGDQIGVVAGKDVRIRVTANQEIVALLWERYEQGAIGPGDIEIRLKDLPDIQITGVITQRIEAGKDRLASPALGFAAGGSIRTDTKDPKGTKAAEKFFELLVKPGPVDDPGSHWHGKVPLLSGQRVTLRVSLPARPLAMQWYRSILQFIEGRFKR